MSQFYTNPVYSRTCPDPYILKYRGQYWCYYTGLAADGRAFGILYSPDLLNWIELGGAMDPLPGDHSCYWAPEVVYDNGSFYMYYSVGNETQMEIRVAVAKSPGGLFVDSGKRLTSEQFAIDAHVFTDEDGQRYLFYATDFLEHSHIGTGTVVDRMLNLYELAGRPQPVTRARFDWQVYDRQRKEKGGVRWHTVEGPFVMKHRGRYYQMFSGGNWQNLSYGVSYATSPTLLNSQEWDQHCDGERVLPILRTLPEQGIIGPGHNSVVRGPDNLQQFCVYHRWVEGANGELERVLAVDRLEWAGDELLVFGPSHTPQPAPVQPLKDDQLDLVTVHTHSGRSTRTAFNLPSPSFVLEAALKTTVSTGHPDHHFGLTLHAQNERLLDAALYPSQQALLVSDGIDEKPHRLPLPEGFQAETEHLLRLEVNGPLIQLSLDHAQPRWQGQIDRSPVRITIFAENTPLEISSLELTPGWVDDFSHTSLDPARLGWIADKGSDHWQIRDGQLWHTNLAGQHSQICRQVSSPDYEFFVNLRLDKVSEAGGTCGLLPAINAEGQGPLLFLAPCSGGWALGSGLSSDENLGFRLPADFEPFTDQPFRLRKIGDSLVVLWKQHFLGETWAPLGPCQVGLYAHQAVAAFDLVRVVGIM
jgi:GH43 family beta-xylosidase